MRLSCPAQTRLANRNMCPPHAARARAHISTMQPRFCGSHNCAGLRRPPSVFHPWGPCQGLLEWPPPPSASSPLCLWAAQAGALGLLALPFSAGGRPRRPPSFCSGPPAPALLPLSPCCPRSLAPSSLCRCFFSDAPPRALILGPRRHTLDCLKKKPHTRTTLYSPPRAARAHRAPSSPPPPRLCCLPSSRHTTALPSSTHPTRPLCRAASPPLPLTHRNEQSCARPVFW